MKKFVEVFDKVRKNEIVCLCSLIAALMYGMFYLDIMNPLEYSLSEIGRFNSTLFIIWCLVSGFALFFNVNRLYERLNYKSKAGSTLLYTGLFFLVLTFLNMKKIPEIWYWIHVSTAILFSILCFASIVFPLLYMFKKNVKYRILSSIFFALVAADIILLAIFKQMALYEFIPLILGYIVMFLINYTDTFKIKE